MSLFTPSASLRLSTAASPWAAPEVEGSGGDIIHFGCLVEALLGAPTAASLSFKWQIQPIQGNGVNLNCESNSVALPWIDVAASDPKLGHLLLDTAFAQAVADQTYPRTATGNSSPYPAGTVLVESRLRVPSFARMVRVIAVNTFTGGTSPAWSLTAGMSIQAQ